MAIVLACHVIVGKELEDVRSAAPQIYEIPFNSASKWMLTAHDASPSSSSSTGACHEDQLSHVAGVQPVRLLLKGAPEFVVRCCSLSEEQVAMRRHSQHPLAS